MVVEVKGRVPSNLIFVVILRKIWRMNICKVERNREGGSVLEKVKRDFLTAK